MKPVKLLYESTYPTTFLLSKIVRHANTEHDVEAKKINYMDLPERDNNFLDGLEIFTTEKNPIIFREPLSEIVSDYELSKFPQYFILERVGEKHVYLIETANLSTGSIVKGVICIDNFNVGYQEQAGFIKETSSKLAALVKSTMKKVHLPSKYFNPLMDAIAEDYEDGDITEITEQDIVEIIDSSDFADEQEESVLKEDTFPYMPSAISRYRHQFGKKVTNANIQAFVNSDAYLKKLHADNLEQYTSFIKQFYITLDEEL